MSFENPTIREPQQMPFYAYLEKCLPAMQKKYPNTEKVRLLGELINKWDQMDEQQKEEYEQLAKIEKNRYKTAIQQALQNITKEIKKIQKREESLNREEKIEKKEQYSEAVDFRSQRQVKKIEAKRQQSKGKKTRFEEKIKKPRKQTPEFDRPGEITLPNEFIAFMTKQITGRGNKSKMNIAPLQTELQERKKSAPPVRLRNKSAINIRQKQPPRRSQRIRSK